jgi:hypothetical protein
MRNPDKTCIPIAPNQEKQRILLLWEDLNQTKPVTANHHALKSARWLSEKNITS